MYGINITWFLLIRVAHQSNYNECVQQLKGLLLQLPEEHYVVLRYLIRFLVMVSQYETTNKMNSMALAIVFGPNLFRYLLLQWKLLVNLSLHDIYIIDIMVAQLSHVCQ